MEDKNRKPIPDYDFKIFSFKIEKHIYQEIFHKQ